MISYYKALLFDNDGVLVDSMAGAEESWKIWGEKYSPGFELQHHHHGRRASDLVLDAVGQELFEEANDHINQLEQDLAHLTSALPGAVDLVKSLAPGTWTIVTSANPTLAKGRLDAAGIPMPKEIVTAYDVTHGKPHPEPYLKGAEKLGVDISDCVVFEDATTGLQAGLEAGAGLLVGIGPAVMDSVADVVVRDLSGITFVNGELFIPDKNRLR
jgi:sugar-phosphatase